MRVSGKNFCPAGHARVALLAVCAGVLLAACKKDMNNTTITKGLMKCVELFAETLTGGWWRVDGQMWMFLAAMCRSIENLHSDISYVLIGGQR